MTRQKEIREYAKSLKGGDWYNHFLKDVKREAFIEGATWADQTMINKACKWLEEHLHEYWGQMPAIPSGFIKKFKKAMEE